jgi:signal transduction histidine kinase
VAELEGLLEILRLASFVGAAIAAALVWYRSHATRSATYVLAAFLSILLVLLLSLIRDDTGWGDAVATVNPLLIMAMPCLLLAFAWSFDGPLPGWVRGVIGAAMIPAVALIVVPAGTAGERTAAQSALVFAFLATWTALAMLAAARLWTAAGGARSILIRLRLMAVAVLVFNAALFAAVFPTPAALRTWTSFVLPIASGGLFLLAFAAPAPLRRMWRSESTQVFVEVQRALIAAEAPEDIYEHVVPRFSELLGADVAVLVNEGEVCATHGMSSEEARGLFEAWSKEEGFGPRVHVSSVGDRVLIARPTRYAPLFDREERQLADGLALHLALALDRAELQATHQEARDEAERARRELETTVVGLAHDLRNPTTSLAGFAHLLATSEDPGERAEMAEHLQASANYIERLVAALLEVSRIGRTQTESEPVDLTALAGTVAERWRAGHPAATVEIGQLCTVQLNPGRAEQLFDNLIGNAIRHGGRDDITVTLRADQEQGELRLTVADDGVGVPPDEREEVFRLFHRSQGNGSGEGSGVGLTLVRRIAESYGGSVHLEEVDRGASIAIRLPGSLVVADGEGRGL